MPTFIDHLERQHVRKASRVKTFAIQVQEKRLLLSSRQLANTPPIAVPEDTFTCLLFTVGEADKELILECDEYLGRLLLGDPLYYLIVGIGTPAIEIGENWSIPPSHFGNRLLEEVDALALADFHH